MEKKLVGKKAEPTRDELEFIYSRLERLSDREILDEMQDVATFPIRSVGFIKRRRREFDTAKRVLREQLAKEIDPLNIERKKGHFKQMAEVAKAILGVHDTTKHTSEDEYDWAHTKGGRLKVDRKELITDLETNIEETREKYRALDVFDHFLAHLESQEPSSKDLNTFIGNDPMKFVSILKLMVSTKGFKGKCPECEEIPKGVNP